MHSSRIAVLDRAAAAPPEVPADGARYMLPAAPTGAFSGYVGKIPAVRDGAWHFFAPREGWLAWGSDDDQLLAWSGSAWVATATPASVNPVPMVGINATADTNNRLAAPSAATLLNPTGAGHQLKINEPTAAATASLLNQTGFAGRAEFGPPGGAGTAGAITVASTTCASAMFPRQPPRLPLPTPHVYARAKTGNLFVRTDGRSVWRNDGLQPAGHFVITPAETWVCVRMLDAISPMTTFGDSLPHIDIYQAAPGDVALLACPTWMSRATTVHTASGIAPAFILWTAIAEPPRGHAHSVASTAIGATRHGPLVRRDAAACAGSPRSSDMRAIQRMPADQ